MVMRWMGRRGAIFPFSGLSFYPRVNLGAAGWIRETGSYDIGSVELF